MHTLVTAVTALLRDPAPYIGAAAAWTIERLNGIVGLLVGLATLAYLCLRIRQEWRHRRSPPRPD